MSDIIIKAAIESIPQFNFKTNSQTLPKKIIEKIEERRVVRAKIRKFGRQEDKTFYNKLKKLISLEIAKFRDEAWNKFIKKCSQNPLSTKPFWKKINKFRKNKPKSSIPTLVHNNTCFETDLEKANLFSNILKDIFNNAPDDQTDINYYCQVENEENYLTSSNNIGIKYEKITLNELKYQIKRLKNDKSPGEDHISNEMLKQLPDSALFHILNLVNHSISTCYLPSAWKLAKITMIPKKKESEDPNNYRSISLTSCIGKLVEKIVQKRLYTFVEENHLLNTEQSGFRKHRKTTDNLFYLTQKVKENLNRNKKVCTLFFDIAKAFDKVWHAGLLEKLKIFKIPEYLINWIRQFLKNRKFFVSINNKSSTIESISSSVPHGSILSPLLFNLFISDIPLLNNKNKNFSFLYADDLAVSFIFKKKGQVVKVMNTYLNQLEKWLVKWRFKMSASKCCYVIFNKSNRNKTQLDLKLFGDEIPYEKNPVYLGATLDEHLSFNNIEVIRAKCGN